MMKWVSAQPRFRIESCSARPMKYLALGRLVTLLLLVGRAAATQITFLPSGANRAIIDFSFSFDEGGWGEVRGSLTGEASPFSNGSGEVTYYRFGLNNSTWSFLDPERNIWIHASNGYTGEQLLGFSPTARSSVDSSMRKQMITRSPCLQIRTPMNFTTSPSSGISWR